MIAITIKIGGMHQQRKTCCRCRWPRHHRVPPPQQVDRGCLVGRRKSFPTKASQFWRLLSNHYRNIISTTDWNKSGRDLILELKNGEFPRNIELYRWRLILLFMILSFDSWWHSDSSHSIIMGFSTKRQWKAKASQYEISGAKYRKYFFLFLYEGIFLPDPGISI